MFIYLNPCLYLTLIGLVVKLWATRKLFLILKQKPINLQIILFIVFFSACYILTVLEFSIYLTLQAPSEATINLIMYSYYIAALIALGVLPLSISSLVYKSLPNWLFVLSACTFLILSYLIINTDYIVTGFHTLRFSYTRTPGPYYFCFQAYVVAIMLICLSVLIKEKIGSKSNIKQTKINNILIGFIPLAAAIILIMDLMRMGFEINMVGFTILLTSIFIIIIVQNLNDNIVDLRIYLPWTKKAKEVRQITKPFWNINPEDGVYKNKTKEYEQKLIELADNMFLSRKDAAKWLGISESKLYRALSTKSKNKDTVD